jgi:hypothetical protein
MLKLHHLAITKKIAVVITNHSSSNPDNDSKYSNAIPFGGNVMSYASQYIINLTHGCKMLGSINAVLNKRSTKDHQPLQLLIGDFGFMDVENNSTVKRGSIISDIIYKIYSGSQNHCESTTF